MKILKAKKLEIFSGIRNFFEILPQMYFAALLEKHQINMILSKMMQRHKAIQSKSKIRYHIILTGMPILKKIKERKNKH